MEKFMLDSLRDTLNIVPSMLVKNNPADKGVKNEALKTLRKKEFLKELLMQLQELDKSESLFHLEMVGRISALISERMGRNTDEVQEIELFAKLHDIGKVGIPSEILNKPGRLTSEEFDVIKSHTEIGYQLLNHLDVSDMGLDIIRYHHEKWDGSGYSGLSGEAIPAAARIVAVADVYDALRMKRPYKDPMTHEEAMEIILKDKGTHFDPAVVDIFLNSHQEIRNIYNTFLN